MTQRISLVFLVLFLDFSLTKAVLTWTREPVDQEVKPGETVVLGCKTLENLTHSTWIGMTNKGEANQVATWYKGSRVLDNFFVGFKVINDFDLQISNVSFPENNGEYKCTLLPEVGETEFRAATITVLQAPSPPTFSISKGVDKNGPYDEGESYDLTCASSGGNPKPLIEWSVDGVVVQSTVGDSAVLTRVFSRQDHRRILSCSVKNNAVNSPLVNSFDVQVNFVPVLTISPLDGDGIHRVIQGETLTLTCVADANPAVTGWAWQRDGADLNQNTRTLSVSGVSVNQRGNYSCLATNARGVGSRIIPVDVLYKPRISLNATYTFRAGNAATVVCVIDANPKESSVIWLNDGSVSRHEARLHFSALKPEDDGMYECRATNAMRPTGGSLTSRTEFASTQIIVEYLPGHPNILGEPKVTQGATIRLTCDLNTQRGNPVADYKWKRTPLSGGAEELLSPGRDLVIDSAQESHAGKYECWGENAVGAGPTALVDVVVMVMPAMDNSWNGMTQEVGEDETKTLICAATGIPRPRLRWIKDGSFVENRDDFSVTSQDVGSDRVESSLIFRGFSRRPTDTSLAPSDAGSFKCSATNDAGIAESTLQLVVLFKPRASPDSADRFAIDVGETGSIKHVVDAVPKPTFTWRKNGADVPINGTRVKIVDTPKLGSTWESRLTLNPVEPSDMGDYECVATNNRGSSSKGIKLGPVTQPDPPTNFRADNVTYKDVTLRWRAGFNGGREQTFYMRLNEANAARRRRRRQVGEDKEIGMERVGDALYGDFEYRVTGLKPDQRYDLDFWARNEKGVNGEGKINFETKPFPVTANDVPKVGSVDVEGNTLRVQVNDTPSGSDKKLCVKVEILKSDRDSYESLVDCGLPQNVVQLPNENLRAVRVRACVVEKQDVCGEPTTTVLSTPWEWWYWLLIALAVLIILIIIILIICCCCCRNKRRKEKEEKKKKALANDYDNDTAHRVRPSSYHARQPPFGADNPAMEHIDLDDPMLNAAGYSLSSIKGGDGAFTAHPVNVVDDQTAPPIYWPSDGPAHRPLSSYNPYISNSLDNVDGSTFRGPGAGRGNVAPPAARSPFILDYDGDYEKKPEMNGYDSGYSAEDHPVAAPQRQPTKVGGKRTIYEVVV